MSGCHDDQRYWLGNPRAESVILPSWGAGVYVDQEVGAAGSTGRGEENIRVAGAHTIVENMRHGMNPKEACLDALKRVVRNYDNDLKRLEKFDLNFYALRKDGEFAGASLWNAVQQRGAWVSRSLQWRTWARPSWEDAWICWTESSYKTSKRTASTSASARSLRYTEIPKKNASRGSLACC